MKLPVKQYQKLAVQHYEPSSR